MRFCKAHDAELHEAILAVGLVDSTHARAVRRYYAEVLPGISGMTLKTFEPRLAAYSVIANLASDAAEEDGQFEAIGFGAVCPICSLGNKVASGWIKQAAASAVARLAALSGLH